MQKAIRKIIFLDVDGVLNSQETLTRTQPGGGIIGIDPMLVLLVHRIIEATGAEIVLSSTWRLGERSRDEVRKAVPFIDVTPSCGCGIRGAEIYKWITENIPYDWRDNLKYAIIDDDSDMLLWQKDNFFQTSFKTGITEDVVDRVIKHFNS